MSYSSRWIPVLWVQVDRLQVSDSYHHFEQCGSNCSCSSVISLPFPSVIAFPNNVEGGLFDTENVVHPFFERMLMQPEQLRASLTRNPTGKWQGRFGQADQPDVVAYLGECFIRLQHERRTLSPDMEVIASRIESMIFQNFQLGFQVIIQNSDMV